MSELVKIENEEPVTTTLIIAEETENSHASVFRMVKKYVSDLEDYGVVRFKIEKPLVGSKGGRPLEYAYLNEQQTTLLFSYMKNTEIIRGFKKRLVSEFYKMRKILIDMYSRQSNEEWQQLRKNGKLTRRSETDTINVFLDYAIEQGSENYKIKERAYSNFTKMENKALFIIQEKFPNVRQVLTGQQLQIISAADQIVEKALKEGMEKGMHYKEIYQMAKERVETFATLIPKTIVPMIEAKLIEQKG